MLYIFTNWFIKLQVGLKKAVLDAGAKQFNSCNYKLELKNSTLAVVWSDKKKVICVCVWH